MGEDQLFFLQISNIGYKIFWNKNVKVYEKIHQHRQNYKWLIERSYRLGVLGHYLDKNQYGNLSGLFLNYSKSIYYLLTKSSTSIYSNILHDEHKTNCSLFLALIINWGGKLE